VKETRAVSRLLTLAAIVAISGCAVATSSRVRDEPRAEISMVSGELHVTNSRDGQAIFQAQGLAPGRSVTGTVQLSNTGTLAGDLGLQQLDVQDQPGANGGRLSDAVHLDVEDVTGGSAIPVFAGQVGALQSRALGSIAPGQARTYRFTASLPDHGAPPTPTGGDNAYAGSALTVRYSWTATAPDPGDGGTLGSGETGGTGTGGGTGGGILEPNARFSVVSKQLVKRGVLDVMATCNRACIVSAWAQMPKGRGARKGLKTSRRIATLPIPGKAARIRLKLSKKSKRELQSVLRQKKKVTLSVSLSVVSAGASGAKAYSKNVAVKRR
jgi:spore coat-associated protein N